ncbi:MAG: glycosyl transferase family 2, partial [Lentisphaerae bacterium]
MAAHPICISIILPVYNSAATLEKSLDSALGQTLRELEVIAVDDGSADESLRLLEQRAAADPRLRVIAFPENRGTLIARAEAVRAAQGEYLLFLDPDDTFRPEAAA